MEFPARAVRRDRVSALKSPLAESPDVLLEGFLDKFTPKVAAVAREALEKMRARFPTAAQLVYDNYNALAIGFAPCDKTSLAIFSIAVFPRWVSLFFLQAAALPDPYKLLRGSGKVARHIVLTSASDLDLPAITALFNAALKSAKQPLDPLASGQLIIKSVSAKQRPRRPPA